MIENLENNLDYISASNLFRDELFKLLREFFSSHPATGFVFLPFGGFPDKILTILNNNKFKMSFFEKLLFGNACSIIIDQSQLSIILKLEKALDDGDRYDDQLSLNLETARNNFYDYCGSINSNETNKIIDMIKYSMNEVETKKELKQYFSSIKDKRLKELTKIYIKAINQKYGFNVILFKQFFDLIFLLSRFFVNLRFRKQKKMERTIDNLLLSLLLKTKSEERESFIMKASYFWDQLSDEKIHNFKLINQINLDYFIQFSCGDQYLLEFNSNHTKKEIATACPSNQKIRNHKI